MSTVYPAASLGGAAGFGGAGGFGAGYVVQKFRPHCAHFQNWLAGHTWPNCQLTGSVSVIWAPQLWQRIRTSKSLMGGILVSPTTGFQLEGRFMARCAVRARRTR